jgi:hypothetical protein
MDRRRIAGVAGALALVAVAARHPTADIQLLTHNTGDLAPHRVQAAVDFGLVGVHLLVTWTADHLR